MNRLRRWGRFLAQPTAIRVYALCVGIFAVGWAVNVFPVVWNDSTLDRLAARIIEGQVFKVADLNKFLPLVDQAEHAAVCRPASVRSAAVIRLRLLEEAIRAAEQSTIERSFDALTASIQASLKCSPADPFLWLVLSWIENTRHGFNQRALDSLQLSYETGPYEGWIALKRCPLALAQFDQLPLALRERVISEFVGLVNSGFHREAAQILTGPGWRWRQKLLPRLEAAKQIDRVAFEREVYKAGYEVEVPGVTRPAERPWHR
jgi:hypothetical protein